MAGQETRGSAVLYPLKLNPSLEAASYPRCILPMPLCRGEFSHPTQGISAFETSCETEKCANVEVGQDTRNSQPSVTKMAAF